MNLLFNAISQISSLVFNLFVDLFDLIIPSLCLS